jgi:hypothetical protein
MQLGLGIPNGTPNDSSNLRMIISMDIMEDEHRLVTIRQLVDSSFQCNAVNGPAYLAIGSPELAMSSFGGLFARTNANTFQ